MCETNLSNSVHLVVAALSVCVCQTSTSVQFFANGSRSSYSVFKARRNWSSSMPTTNGMRALDAVEN